MKLLVRLTLLMMVVAVVVGMPKDCQGSSCRRSLQGSRSPARASRPQVRAPFRPTSRPVVAERPAEEEPEVELTETLSEGPQETETELPETNASEEEVQDVGSNTEVAAAREETMPQAGVDGWLSAPTSRPPKQARTEPPAKITEKPGSCKSPKGFGIKCMMRLDQCKHDGHCPGSTKCCMVGECGYLCVKPRQTTKDEPKNDKLKSKDKVDLKEEEVRDSDEEAAEVATSQPIAEAPEGRERIEEVQETELQVEEEAEEEEKEDGGAETKEMEESVDERVDDLTQSPLLEKELTSE